MKGRDRRNKQYSVQTKNRERRKYIFDEFEHGDIFSKKSSATFNFPLTLHQGIKIRTFSRSARTELWMYVMKLYYLCLGR